MPELCRFLGIIIRMYFDDHNPPHFHAIYGKHEGLFSIDTLEMIEGNLPPRVKSLVIEWADLHRQELKDNWEMLIRDKKVKKIKPLV